MRQVTEQGIERPIFKHDDDKVLNSMHNAFSTSSMGDESCWAVDGQSAVLRGFISNTKTTARKASTSPFFAANSMTVVRPSILAPHRKIAAASKG